MIDVCFVTVCGGGEEYEYLLGSIEHHAALGMHVVLDTSPQGQSKLFTGLPSSVFWIRSLSFGAGWEAFRFREALNYAISIAESEAPDVIVKLDCDDFFTSDIGLVLPAAMQAVVELQYVHWLQDQKPYLFGDSEWHGRMWPAGRGVRFRDGKPMSGKALFRQNRQVHPELEIPAGLELVRSEVLCRHHAHFAVGEKAADTRIAKQSITGWPHGKMEVAPADWPAPLEAWRRGGKKPSERFQ